MVLGTLILELEQEDPPNTTVHSQTVQKTLPPSQTAVKAGLSLPRHHTALCLLSAEVSPSLHLCSHHHLVQCGHAMQSNMPRHCLPRALTCYQMKGVCARACMRACVRAKLLQSRPTLCNPMDCSPPDSSSVGFSRQEYWSE